jgi:hypothetical protein
MLKMFGGLKMKDRVDCEEAKLKPFMEERVSYENVEFRHGWVERARGFQMFGFSLRDFVVLSHFVIVGGALLGMIVIYGLDIYFEVQFDWFYYEGYEGISPEFLDYSLYEGLKPPGE